MNAFLIDCPAAVFRFVRSNNDALGEAISIYKLRSKLECVKVGKNLCMAEKKICDYIDFNTSVLHCIVYHETEIQELGHS